MEQSKPQDFRENELNYVYHDALNILRTDVICHHGILGMKWGIRRYQNKDGSLTAEGRARLNIDKMIAGRTEDVLINKGTDVNRWVSTGRKKEFEDYLKDPNFPKERKELIKKKLEEMLNDNKEDKYVSIDNIRTGSNKVNGKDFYMDWFTNEGWEPDNGHVNNYKLKKDIKIASAKKVMDAILQETPSEKITQLLSNNKTASDLAMEYTNNRELQKRVNDRFRSLGYDGVEDINDNQTEMPVLLFNANSSLGKATSTQSGEEALDEYFKRRKQ